MKYFGKNILNHTLELKKGNVSGSVSSTGSFGAGFIDNKLGIGTTAPDTELHIAQGSAGSVDTHVNVALTLEGSGDTLLQFQTPNDTDTVGILFGDPDDRDVGRVIYDHTADTLNLFAAGAQQFRLASNKLTIGNNFNNNSGVLNVAPGSGTSPTMFFEQYTSATDGTLGEISFGNRAVDGQLALIQVKNDGANDSAYMAFHTEVTSGALTERVRIHSAGTIEFKGANQIVSGSSTSTGSFGSVVIPAGGKLFFDGGLNTYLQESSDGVIDVYGDNVHLASFIQNGTQSEVVINEGSGDVDFRVESNNDQHAFFVEAEDAGKVGIGTDSPARKLEIKDTSSNVGIRLTTGTALDAIIDLGDTGDADIGQIRYDNNTDKMHFRTNASDRLTIDSSGNIEALTGNISSSISATGSFGHLESAGNFLPKTDNAVDLGSSARRWANVFVGDLVLSNEGSGGNEIDGTEGNWIVQEGEENLYLLNKKNGKKYKFKLEEVE